MGTSTGKSLGLCSLSGLVLVIHVASMARALFGIALFSTRPTIVFSGLCSLSGLVLLIDVASMARALFGIAPIR